MKTNERKNHRARLGFTLVELMIVVTILGILATVAIPMYSSYVYKSKTAEAIGFLSEIKSRQESYRSDFGQYCDVSANANNWYPTDNPGDTTQPWANETNWQQLGAQPPGRQVLFSYASVAGIPGTFPSSLGFTAGGFNAAADDNLGYDGTDFWFISRALGDLDGDDVNVTFESYSHSQSVWTSNASGWE